MRVRRFLHLVLLFIVGALAWQVVVTWSRPLPHIGAVAPNSGEPETPVPPLPGPRPQTGRQFAEVIANKDLFSPSRSREVEESPSVETIPPPSHLKLVGVILTPAREEAFFADASQGGKVVRVKKGESLGSYRLSQIGPLQVTLTLGEDGEEVSLPLLVLDSATAAQGRNMLPVVSARTPTTSGQDESLAIRRNIMQLQRRLRQIRRQAARERAEEAAENGEEDEEEEAE